MAELFDAQRETAELQGAVQRRRTTLAATVAPPSSEPIFRVDTAGNVTSREGRIIRPALPPLELGGKK